MQITFYLILKTQPF